MSLLNKVVAVFLGIVIHSSLVFFIEAFTQRLYPPPPNVDFSNQESVVEYIKTLSLAPMLMVLFASMIGVSAASLFSSWYSKTPSSALILGGFVTLACLTNVILVPGHPIWFMIISIASPFPLSYICGNLVCNPNKKVE